MSQDELIKGYVYIHSGIHGIGGLDPAEFDWHNPFATIMSVRLNQVIKSLSLSILFLLLIGFENMESHANEADLTQATFYVYWYDVGKSALEGLKGVKKVENGWHNLKEINRVFYDPAAVRIDEMEAALKRAKTYQGTAGVAAVKRRFE